MGARSDGLRSSAEIRRWRSAILGGGGSSGTDLGAEAYDQNWLEHLDPARFTVTTRICRPAPESGIKWTSCSKIPEFTGCLGRSINVSSVCGHPADLSRFLPQHG